MELGTDKNFGLHLWTKPKGQSRTKLEQNQIQNTKRY